MEIEKAWQDVSTATSEVILMVFGLYILYYNSFPIFVNLHISIKNVSRHDKISFPNIINPVL